MSMYAEGKMKERVVAVIEPGYADYDVETALLEPLGVRVERIRESEDTVSALRDMDPVGILIREAEVSEAEMQVCPNLRVIVRYGVGTDNVDSALAREHGIYVANVPDYGAEIEVSEHALALYLAVQRRVVTRDGQVRQGGWNIGQDAPIPGRREAVLGLIGCGRIGIQTARKFCALGFSKVLVFDPYIDEQVLREEGFQAAPLDELFRQADVLSLHSPLTPETRNIVNRERLACMKSSSIIINVARGGLIDEVALAEALKQGRLYGAGIDVLEQEPPPDDHVLFGAPNTVLSDHVAWYSERSVSELQTRAARELQCVLQGGEPANWINRWTDEKEEQA